MRILAIDYGDTRTGVAVSDAAAQIAGDAFVIVERQWDRLIARLAEEAGARGVKQIVVGHPLNMDGSAGPRAEKSRLLAERLGEQTGLPVALWDERRTTVDAVRILHASGKRGPKGRAKVDAVAACLILEGYLASLPYRSGG